MKRLSLFYIISLFTLLACNKDANFEPGDGDAGTLTPVPGAVFGDTTIVDGYFKRFAINNTGDSLEMFINAKRVSKNVKIKIYNGAGAFVTYLYVDSIIPQKINTAKAYEDGYGYTYKVTAKINLPGGYYSLGKKIPFIVKDASKTGDVVVLYPQNTVNAYNSAGGGSSYTSNKLTRVSFLRPTPATDQFLGGFLKYNTIYPNMDWIADLDMEDYSNIQNYKVLVIVGHSEYWTRQARMNLDRFISEGKHVILLSGNSVWWQVRYSDDRTQMICYKDYYPDPELNVLLRTTTWNVPILNYPIIGSIGADFTYAGYGVKLNASTGRPLDSGWDGYKILKATSPLLAGTNLLNGSIISCPGKEWDGAPVIYVNQTPVLDSVKLKFYKSELIGYDRVTRSTSINTNTTGTFLVFQKTPTSGIVVNVCNTNWCATNGMNGLNGDKLRMITYNAINKLVANENVFSY